MNAYGDYVKRDTLLVEKQKCISDITMNYAAVFVVHAQQSHQKNADRCENNVHSVVLDLK
jgi:hypothetical protein